MLRQPRRTALFPYGALQSAIRLAVAVAIVGLAACVAPESAPPPRVQRPASAAPPASTGYETAPTPNRRLRAGPNDSVISIKP